MAIGCSKNLPLKDRLNLRKIKAKISYSIRITNRCQSAEETKTPAADSGVNQNLPAIHDKSKDLLVSRI